MCCLHWPDAFYFVGSVWSSVSTVGGAGGAGVLKRCDLCTRYICRRQHYPGLNSPFSSSGSFCKLSQLNDKHAVFQTNYHVHTRAIRMYAGGFFPPWQRASIPPDDGSPKEPLARQRLCAYKIVTKGFVGKDECRINVEPPGFKVKCSERRWVDVVLNMDLVNKQPCWFLLFFREK